MARTSSRRREWFVAFESTLWLRPDDTGRDEAVALKRLLRLRKGKHVLDCPCGAGRIAFHLAKAGCKVTGVDRVASFLTRARRRFRKAHLAGEFLQCDMRQLDFHDQFHAVINFFGSFGYFSDQENLQVLRRFAAALRPGGRVLIDQPNRERILRHFRPRAMEGKVHQTTQWRNQRCETTWTFTRRGRRRRCRSIMRFYTPGQFRRLLARAGLVVQGIYGGLDGQPYRRSSRRICVVGRKA
ncbi:MAG: class I SAM-dependent methyltransferase [Phycisphaerae bacterium]|nr:class I SAM-dependent methyltransferase [Phycisphaerae bacterium]